MEMEYNEQTELMNYVRRNYPELFADQPRTAPPEEVLAAVPDHLREEHLARCAECRRIIEETHRKEERLSRNGTVASITPLLPEASEELTAVTPGVFEEHRRRIFSKVYSAHSDCIDVLRCPECDRIVATARARQCLWCGHDWHGE